MARALSRRLFLGAAHMSAVYGQLRERNLFWKLGYASLDKKAISAPVLFFYGRSDWMVGPSHYKSAHFPLMLLWPSAVGHVPFLENPADLDRAITSYRRRFRL